jgi:hypothetical protein
LLLNERHGLAKTILRERTTILARSEAAALKEQDDDVWVVDKSAGKVNGVGVGADVEADPDGWVYAHSFKAFPERGSRTWQSLLSVSHKKRVTDWVRLRRWTRKRTVAVVPVMRCLQESVTSLAQVSIAADVKQSVTPEIKVQHAPLAVRLVLLSSQVVYRCWSVLCVIECLFLFLCFTSYPTLRCSPSRSCRSTLLWSFACFALFSTCDQNIVTTQAYDWQQDSLLSLEESVEQVVSDCEVQHILHLHLPCALRPLEQARVCKVWQ